VYTIIYRDPESGDIFAEETLWDRSEVDAILDEFGPLAELILNDIC
jgi:hypothetical protein